MSVTIADVARLASVSKATVSAVLNDRPGISPKTRVKVLEVIKKLDYHPNQIARALSNKETKSIGLVIKEIDNPFFAKITKGVFDICSQQGYTVLLGSSELSPAKERECIETLIKQRVDGLIISPLQGSTLDFTYLSELISQNYPLVTLEKVQNHRTNFVDIDNAQAACQAVSYLIRQGHTRIAHFAGPGYSAHANDRIEGYKQAFIDHRLKLNPQAIIRVGSYIQNGYQKGRELFKTSHLPSAVFCYNDLVAIGLLNALEELNISVPGSISVLGFDDIEFCESVKVPLTTVHVPSYEIGQSAADLLIQQIKQRMQPLNRNITLAASLIVRKSCASIMAGEK